MATKIFCDRCGDEILSEKKIHIMRLVAESVYFSNHGRPSAGDLKRELCEDCTAKLHDFLNDRKRPA